MDANATLVDIQAWLERAGFPANAEITTMTPGLGQTMLWRISGLGPDGDLVLRLFPIGNERPRDRETLAMRTARCRTWRSRSRGRWSWSSWPSWAWSAPGCRSSAAR